MGRMKSLLDAIHQEGWGMIQNFQEKEISIRLRDECTKACQTKNFPEARIGSGSSLHRDPEIRKDQILWLLQGEAFPEQTTYQKHLDLLRIALNERFFLGLIQFQGHFALYPEGGFYKTHLDCHAGKSDRIITVILYLNENWIAGDGGELKLWTTHGEKTGAFVLIEPQMGTLVCFPSADYWHEVLPTTKSRRSITGWFLQRSLPL